MAHRAAAALGFACIASATVVSNVAPRYDVNGAIVNAHDGCLVQFPNDPMIYMYGTVYEACAQNGPICDGVCGYLNNTFAVYSTPDLQTWTLLNANVLPQLSRDNARVSYWEANVGYNAVTQQYVMLFWSGHYGFVNSSIAVATSASPAGPFTLVPPINVTGTTVISDTVALFVDDDGTAYARYNTFAVPRQHIIERLSPSWLSSTGESAVIFSKPDFPWYDGGGMLKRGGKYYVMLSFDCCFCQWGSDALVFVADAPLGPWTPQPSVVSPPRLQLQQLRAPSVSPCNVSGQWVGAFPGQPIAPPDLLLTQAAGSANVSITGAVTTTAYIDVVDGTLVFPDFPGYGLLIGALAAFNDSSDACSMVTWLDYTPPGTMWCKTSECAPSPVPPPVCDLSGNWSGVLGNAAHRPAPAAPGPGAWQRRRDCDGRHAGSGDGHRGQQQPRVRVLPRAAGRAGGPPGRVPIPWRHGPLLHDCVGGLCPSGLLLVQEPRVQPRRAAARQLDERGEPVRYGTAAARGRARHDYQSMLAAGCEWAEFYHPSAAVQRGHAAQWQRVRDVPLLWRALSQRCGRPEVA